MKQEMLPAVPQTHELGQQVGYVPPHPPLPMSYISMVGCAIICAKKKGISALIVTFTALLITY